MTSLLKWSYPEYMEMRY